MTMTSPSPVPFLAQEVLVIVEDDPALADALSFWFELQARVCVLHASVESLMGDLHVKNAQLCLSRHPDDRSFKLVCGMIVDLNLPGLSGLDLIRGMRSEHPALPMVMMTSMSASDRNRFGPLPPNVECLVKPFPMDALDGALHRGRMQLMA